ncbi:DNA-binding MarR family transcriptional regulator [Tumebacillus sp. BK434]|uniref:MarR family winged helix-turn-helix transcriptional regulator n=1 Tax=Tumebacillus sp. BK434 TaxID=2512169 RepID=UPI001051BEC6|nr:MarR family transcriptional regulator [Tumebacillus sp. BK434]TCP55990.1 DNA-binding MarR family transcriptional regulator [Tumebacillus sp. BK434]
MNKQYLEILELELAKLVRNITSLATNKKKFGNLDRSAYLLLHYISDHGAVGVKTLAEGLRLDISTASRQATALEQKGYVTRTPDPLDGRAFTFSLTASGEAEYARTKQERMERISVRLHDWSDDEREQFGQLLGKFNDSFK